MFSAERPYLTPGFAGVATEGATMIGTVLLIVLVLLVIGSLPVFSYNRKWGYAPSGLFGTVLIVLLILVLLGKI